MKHCPKCKNDWPLVCFWKDRTRPDRLSRLCKNCQSVKSAWYWKTVYYPKNRARIIANVTARRKVRQTA